MSNIAILVGNTNYRALANLECCAADLAAMKELLEATEKYDTLEIIQNVDASELKAKIRGGVDKAKSPTELFFYFTGHGYVHADEFFFCATKFDPSRPNETGLSTTELHTLLRLANADVVVKVVDACNSGTHLIKSDIGLTQQNKQGFKNLIQISSCLDSQSSLTGHPLSLFTEKFRNASLSKTSGVVHYMDVIGALRDQFIGNDGQTPFFVQQGTGREEFVDDAHKFDKVRETIEQRTAAVALASPAALPTRSQTLTELLTLTEAKLATAEAMSVFVAIFFDKLKEKLSKADFSEYFQLEFAEHDTFKELTTQRFIIEVMSREKRADNFVTAEISRKRRRANPLLNSAAMSALYGWYDDDQFIEAYDLELNCQMARVQLRATLTPKFSTLQRIVLVVTCAPSLGICYVFEVATLHMLYDFGKYDNDGTNAVKRWYKFAWNESTDGVVEKITNKLSEIVTAHIKNTAKRLEGEN
ncbi:MAG: caspase family protein [Alphaproteobacteria bacterium]|nr:caspase family protein [Alphaproteobacteria bacterium]MDE2074783.1 caspase family protein [Alphaproteobacteria bacterium]